MSDETTTNQDPRSVNDRPPSVLRDDWWTELRDEPRRLFEEGCRRFGLNADPDASEVLSVKAYGDPRFHEPCKVVFVTGGGRKLSWPIDAKAEEQLRFQVFRAFRRDASGVVTPLPLPADLTLPATARTGQSPPSHELYR